MAALSAREALQADLACDKLLAKHAAVIAERAMPAILATPVTSGSKPGRSRIGGAPDLPAGTAWPRFVAKRAALAKRYVPNSVAAILNDANAIDVPFAFIAQFRLEDVAPFDTEGYLPKTGLLSFFFRPDLMFQQRTTGTEWRYHLPCEVIHSAATGLVRAKPPRELASWASPATSVAFASAMLLPDYDQLGIDLGRGSKAYIARTIAQLDLPPHQLLCLPTGTHDVDVPPADGHVLFSAPLPQEMFDGAFSCAYFCISNKALRRRAFDQTYVLISSE